MCKPNSETPATPAEAQDSGGSLDRLVRRCAFLLLATGDSLNGWVFKMHSKAVSERREDAEAHLPAFRAACCDQQHFECADEKTLKVEIIERDLYSPNTEAEPPPNNAR